MFALPSPTCSALGTMRSAGVRSFVLDFVVLELNHSPFETALRPPKNLILLQSLSARFTGFDKRLQEGAGFFVMNIPRLLFHASFEVQVAIDRREFRHAGHRSAITLPGVDRLMEPVPLYRAKCPRPFFQPAPGASLVNFPKPGAGVAPAPLAELCYV